MAHQNINQYNYKKFNLNLLYDGMDMSLASDEKDYNEEVVFSPYIIAQTYGNKLPFYFDLNDSETSQQINLNYKQFNPNNIVVSQNYYNPDDKDLSCFSASSSCDIGFTGIDNGLVDNMSNQTINFTEGIFGDNLKFDRQHFDRRLKLFQITGHTNDDNRFEVFTKKTLYEIVSKDAPGIGRYNELYGGFYQGFYKLFGYDYEIFPERVNKGWTVEMVIKPRLEDEYVPGPNETTLNNLYPKNKNIFFYLGARAENKFYHYADGTPNCFSGYTRITTPLANCLQTCACCNQTITNSRCIYLYPPRSVDGIHDPHLNYGCDVCQRNPLKSISCECDCNGNGCQNCGWECRTHNCDVIIPPTPTPTPEPTPVDTCNTPTPTCTPTCTTCEECITCDDCASSGFTSVENTCESDPLFDLMSNNIAFKLCGDPKNPSIGIKVLRFTGGCETTGTCVTGNTYMTGYTIQEYCSPPIYKTCEQKNPAWLNLEHWFMVNVVWTRYTNFDFCDLKYFGGLGVITKTEYLESLSNNATALIKPPYTRTNNDGETIEIVNLNEKWLNERKHRLGRLEIYVNGKRIYSLENFEEVIPRALNTDKEKQVGVPFNISWGGGTQGLHENLIPQSCSGLTGPYIQDPELFPTSTLSASTFSGLTTNILLEQEFAGTFDGGISQFRMYVEPLGVDEIKHNFNVVKDNFGMFDPDCPNCETDFCQVDDFTFEITDHTTTTTTSNITPTPTITPTNTPTITPTNTPTPTPTPILPTVYYGKYSSQQFNINDLDLLTTIQTNNIINNYIPYNDTPGFCYILIPESLQQPTLFRNSNDDCSGFIIPFVRLDDVIIDSGGEFIIYYVYRTFVLTHTAVDVWVCE